MKAQEINIRAYKRISEDIGSVLIILNRIAEELHNKQSSLAFLARDVLEGTNAWEGTSSESFRAAWKYFYKAVDEQIAALERIAEIQETLRQDLNEFVGEVMSKSTMQMGNGVVAFVGKLPANDIGKIDSKAGKALADLLGTIPIPSDSDGGAIGVIGFSGPMDNIIGIGGSGGPSEHPGGHPGGNGPPSTHDLGWSVPGGKTPAGHPHPGGGPPGHPGGGPPGHPGGGPPGHPGGGPPGHPGGGPPGNNTGGNGSGGRPGGRGAGINLGPQTQAIIQLLDQTPEGGHALDVIDRRGVAVVWGPPGGGGTHYDPNTNTIYIDPADEVPLDVQIVHEATHADYFYNGQAVSPTNLDRQDYIDAKIDEEAVAVVNAINYAVGQDIEGHVHDSYNAPGWSIYAPAYNIAYEESYHQTHDENRAREDGEFAGMEAIVNALKDGRLFASTTGTTHAQIYGAQWDHANPHGGAHK